MYEYFPSKMRWYERTPYIRIYLDVHPMASLWGFFGQCLYQRLELVADYAGVVELPDVVEGDLPRGVAILIDCEDVEWVDQYLHKLMTLPNPAVEHVNVDDKHYLVLTSYWDAQNLSQGNAAAGRRARKKARDYQRATELGLIRKLDETG